MMYRIQDWKQLAVSLLLFITIFSCKKHRPVEGPQNPPPGETPSSTVYESLLSFHPVSYCGSPLTSTLKIQDGTDIGTVTVGNDALYLYLTYNVTGDWYLGDAHCYAGQQSLIPRNSDGNPIHGQFPGKQNLNFCDLRQTFTFRVLLSSLGSDNSAQCSTNAQYYIAMRASVKQISNGADCGAATDQPAWGAPFLINPGNTNEWATAFYSCKQDCTIPVTPWCAYSQGYWFNNPDVSWCQNVKFGTLEINKQDGVALWPAQNNWVRKALFQASALQLSMSCANNGNSIPDSIAPDYNKLNTFLSTLSYTDIQNGIVPSGTDSTLIKTVTGNIGKWICHNHCNSTADSTACSGY
jgi:hypothetical protein